MRTTILLPDELYDAVRQFAAAERRTITSVIEEALLDTLRKYVATESRAPFAVDVIEGRGLQPGVDLDDNAALADLMDRS